MPPDQVLSLPTLLRLMARDRQQHSAAAYQQQQQRWRQQMMQEHRHEASAAAAAMPGIWSRASHMPQVGMHCRL